MSSDDYNQSQVKIAEYEHSYDYEIAQRGAVESAVIAQHQTEEQAFATLLPSLEVTASL